LKFTGLHFEGGLWWAVVGFSFSYLAIGFLYALLAGMFIE